MLEKSAVNDKWKSEKSSIRKILLSYALAVERADHHNK